MPKFTAATVLFSRASPATDRVDNFVTEGCELFLWAINLLIAAIDKIPNPPAIKIATAGVRPEMFCAKKLAVTTANPTTAIAAGTSTNVYPPLFLFVFDVFDFVSENFCPRMIEIEAS